jgi:hypothetical protein
MAAAALQLLLADLKVKRRGRSGTQEVILDHDLVIRESSGPAPAGSNT